MKGPSAPSGTALVRYDAACQALAEAKAVDEVLEIRDHAAAIQAAARVAKNPQLESDAYFIRTRGERRVGEMMAVQREKVGLASGGKPYQSTGSAADPVRPTLADAGIDKHLADRARKLAAIPKQEFDTKIVEAQQRVRAESVRATDELLGIGEKHIRGTFGTGENEWYTPKEYIAAARDVLGGIDLDPATSKYAQENIKADVFYTADDDGLKQEWHGTVWLNPPYAQPLIADFVFKLVDEVKAGRVTAAVMLTHNYTDTAWFQEAASAASAICSTRGRVKFVDARGNVAAPTQGQAFFYFGDETEAFAERFADIGFVAHLEKTVAREVADAA